MKIGTDKSVRDFTTKVAIHDRVMKVRFKLGKSILGNMEMPVIDDRMLLSDKREMVKKAMVAANIADFTAEGAETMERLVDSVLYAVVRAEQVGIS